MWRIIILVSILPFLVSGFFANWFGLRRFHKAGTLNRSVSQNVANLLEKMNRKDMVVSYGRSFMLGSQNSANSITIPSRYKSSYKVKDLGLVLTQLGMVLLSEKHPSPIAWRRSTVKTGYILPAFTLMIVLFSCIIGKLPALIGLAALSASLGISSVLLWLSLAVEKEAAHLMVDRVESLRLFSKLEEEERVVSAIQATPWVSLVPGALLKLMLKD